MLETSQASKLKITQPQKAATGTSRIHGAPSALVRNSSIDSAARQPVFRTIAPSLL